MAAAVRYDTAEMTLVESESGFLRARLTLARPGVFAYAYRDGVRMEAKLPEELFSSATIESAKGAPVTLGHPARDDCEGLVVPANFRKHLRGALGDQVTVVAADDGSHYLEAWETIFDASLIAELRAGRSVQVSIGFTQELDCTPGEYEGQRYDSVQRNIRINHVAHVDAARAGPGARVHLDAADDGDVGWMIPNQNEKGDSLNFEQFMKKMAEIFGAPVTTDGAAAGDAGAAAGGGGGADGSSAARQKKDTASGSSAAESDVARLAAENESLRAQLAEMRREMDELRSPQRLDAAANERIELIGLLRSVAADLRTDALDTPALKRAVVDAVLPAVKGRQLTSVQLDAYYDSAAELARSRAAERQSESAVGLVGVRADESEVARKRAARLSLASSPAKEAR